MQCSSCGGQTASDAASVHWCVLCGANVTLQREKRIMAAGHIDSITVPASYLTGSALNDTAEYKPLLAEELSQ